MVLSVKFYVNRVYIRYIRSCYWCSWCHLYSDSTMSLLIVELTQYALNWCRIRYFLILRNISPEVKSEKNNMYKYIYENWKWCWAVHASYIRRFKLTLWDSFFFFFFAWDIDSISFSALFSLALYLRLLRNGNKLQLDWIIRWTENKNLQTFPYCECSACAFECDQRSLFDQNVKVAISMINWSLTVWTQTRQTQTRFEPFCLPQLAFRSSVVIH